MLRTMPVTPKRLIVVLLLATFAGCRESPAPPSESGTVAIVGARLIVGTGTDPIADSVIVIRDGRIEAAGPRSSTVVPEGADVIDGAGKTVMPGLVETHAHYHGDLARVEQQFRKQLYVGVTTSRSIGSDRPEKVAKAADLIVLNADPLADIENTLETDRVMRAGTWLDRAEFLPIP